MTLTTYTPTNTSTRYTATVNGASLPLWGRTTDTQLSTPYWSAGASIDQSWATIATDETVTIRVSLVSGSITSAKVYTNDAAGPVIASTISAGALTFSLPPNTCAWCEINGLRGQPLLLSSKLPVTQPTGGTVDTYVAQTKAVAGRTLVFPAGTHTVGQSFEVESGASVWIHGSAKVIGSFRFTGFAGGHNVAGHGVLSGEWGSSLRATIRTYAFADQIPYSMIYGEFSTTLPSKVSGITIVDPPFYVTHFGASQYEYCTMIGPWWANSDAFNVAQYGASLTGRVLGSMAFVHDNAIFLEEYLKSHDYSDNIVGSLVSSGIQISFWPNAEQTPDIHTGTNNTVVSFYSTDGLITAWCDGYSQDLSISGIYLQKLRVVGQVPFRLFAFANRLYPIEWGAQEKALGQIKDISFTDVDVEFAPAQKSLIAGLGYIQGPANIYFWNVRIAGTLLTVENFFDYFEFSGLVYNIYVGGKAVATSVDIANQALAAVSAKARVQSLVPPDQGSIEAELCNRYLNESVETVLEMHPWAFATKRIAMVSAGETDTTSWLYRYEIPDDMCRAISVLPQGVTHDQISGGVRAPVEYVRELDEDGVLRIYTNEPDATLRYTAWVPDPNKWSPLFRQAVVAMLASKIAGPLWRGPEGEAVKQRCLRDVEVYLARAKASDATQQRVTPEPQIASYMQNRRGGASSYKSRVWEAGS